MRKNFVLAPSILSADFSRLGEEIEKILSAGADVVHFDVMDNHYVPNITVGPIVCQAIRNYNITAPIDVHLMINPVDRIIKNFAKSGANNISFHIEASDHVDRTIQIIQEYGCTAGLVLNPGTSLNSLDYVLNKIDRILLMSVNPGFSGQYFIKSTLDKVRKVRKWILENGRGRDINLEVDGGVNVNNIAEIADAGANMFVIGSAIFGKVNYPKEITNLHSNVTKLVYKNSYNIGNI